MTFAFCPFPPWGDKGGVCLLPLSEASGLFQLEQLVAVEPSHSPVVEGHGVYPVGDACYLSRECPLFLESYASA